MRTIALLTRGSARRFRFSAISSDSLRRFSVTSRKPVRFAQVEGGTERVTVVVELEIHDSFGGVGGFVDVAGCNSKRVSERDNVDGEESH